MATAYTIEQFNNASLARTMEHVACQSQSGLLHRQSIPQYASISHSRRRREVRHASDPANLQDLFCLGYGSLFGPTTDRLAEGSRAITMLAGIALITRAHVRSCVRRLVRPPAPGLCQVCVRAQMGVQLRFMPARQCIRTCD